MLSTQKAGYKTAGPDMCGHYHFRRHYTQTMSCLWWQVTSCVSDSRMTEANDSYKASVWDRCATYLNNYCQACSLFFQNPELALNYRTQKEDINCKLASLTPEGFCMITNYTGLFIQKYMKFLVYETFIMDTTG